MSGVSALGCRSAIFFVAMDRFIDHRGYTSYIDDEAGASVREHQLCALASGYDPEEVFDNHVHHRVMIPTEYGVQLDLPGAVVPVSPSTHHQLHQNEENAPSIGQLINQ